MAKGAAAQRLAHAIDERRSEIERRWLERVQQDVVRTPGVELTQLRDGIPEYLSALVAALSRYERHQLDDSAGSAWDGVAREHGITRVRIGFDIGQLVHEFIVLRRVIRDIVHEAGVAGDDYEAMLADMLDAAITAAVQAYVAARDHEARRTQAENIGFLTHELRNPLSSAMFAATKLRGQIPGGDRTALEALDRNLQRMSDLVDSVLRTQQLEAGEMESHPVAIALRDVMEDALEAARGLAEDKGLDFRVRYDPDLIANIDPALAASAIQNLVDNAAKYTDAGHVDISVDDEPHQVTVHVRDTCRGLSREELATIFQPFKRGHTGKSGTGLGLTIARRAAEAQGGRVHAESTAEAGGGCHFWITLPKPARHPGDE